MHRSPVTRVLAVDGWHACRGRAGLLLQKIDSRRSTGEFRRVAVERAAVREAERPGVELDGGVEFGHVDVDDELQRLAALRRATFAACLPSAVRVRLGSLEMVFLRLAAAAAFLTLRRAAVVCLRLAMATPWMESRGYPAREAVISGEGCFSVRERTD